MLRFAIKQSLMISVMVLFFSAKALAVASCAPGVMTELGPEWPGDSHFYEVVVTCTAAANGQLGVTLNATTMAQLAGKWTHTITNYPGAPAMTIGAEVEIRDSLGRKVLSSAGNGNDFIVVSGAKTVFPTSPSGSGDYLANPAYPWTIYVENSIVSGGVVNFIFTLFK